MVIIKPYQTAVSLFHKDGEVRVFPSMDKARKELGQKWINANVGRNFFEFSHCSDRLYFDNTAYRQLKNFSPDQYAIYKSFEWVMRNDAGEPLVGSDFYIQREYRYTPYGFSTWNGEGPVPRTGKWRGGSHGYHHMKTTAERRASFCIEEDGEVPPRAARNARNLPNAWDDWRHSDIGIRNWKRFRKTQFK